MPPKKKAVAGSTTTNGSKRKGKMTVVKRKPKSESAYKPRKPAPPLPTDWPVTSRAPRYPEDASALQPGSLLRRQCTGQDIHLAKSAVANPNIEKAKGKYLFLLPGSLSLKPQTNNPPKAAQPATISQTQESAPSTDPSSLIPQEEGDEETPAAPVVSNNPFISKRIHPRLGQVENLKTDTPRLVIPFPKKSQQLVFPGKKVPTSSKYLILTCSTKKKGSVTCKNIFSSAIVFGQPEWEKLGGIKQKEAVEEIQVDIFDDDDDSDEDMTEDNKRKLPSVVHYGGSERTLDGMGSNRGAKKVATISSSDSGRRLPIYCQQQAPSKESLTTLSKLKQVGDKIDEIELSDDETPEPDEPVLDDDLSSDEEFLTSMNTVATKVAPRSAPRRTASTKSAKYTQDSSSASSSSSDDEDNFLTKQQTKKPQAKKPQQRQRPAKKKIVDMSYSSDNDDVSSAAQQDSEVENVLPKPTKKPVQAAKKTQQTAGRPLAKKKMLDVSFSSDSSENSVVNKTKMTSTTTSTGKNQRTKPKAIENLASDDDDSDEFSGNENTSPVNPRRPSSRRSSSGNKAVSYKEAEGEGDDDSFSGSNASSSKSDEEKTLSSSTKKQKMTTAKKAPAKAPPKKQVRKSVSGSSSSTTKRGKATSATAHSRKGTASTGSSDATTKRSNAISAGKRKRPPTTGTVEISSDEENEDWNATSTTPTATTSAAVAVGGLSGFMYSPPSTSPGFRSRKKKKTATPKKKSPASKVLDLSKDDEFAFG